MKTPVAIVAGILTCAALAAPQETGRLGLNLRVEPAPRIGLTWHVSGRLALRPSIGFVQTSIETATESEVSIPENPRRVESEEETTAIGFGLGIHYYVYKVAAFSIYTGLNVNYTRETADLSVERLRDLDRQDSGDVWQGSAVLGVQTRLNEHFSLFGEAGFGYTYGTLEREGRARTDATTRRWGLANSGVGLIFYF
jgi:opacity protein-like surface antigen